MASYHTPWCSSSANNPEREATGSNSYRSAKQHRIMWALEFQILRAHTFPTSPLFCAFMPVRTAMLRACAKGDPPPHGIVSRRLLAMAMDFVGGRSTSARSPCSSVAGTVDAHSLTEGQNNKPSQSLFHIDSFFTFSNLVELYTDCTRSGRRPTRTPFPPRAPNISIFVEDTS